MRAFLFILLLFVSPIVANAAQFQLAPYKDALFAYPKILKQSQKGAYRLVEYDRERDLIGRDEIPRRKAHHRYVSQNVRWSRSVRSFRSNDRSFKYFIVGKPGPHAKIAVIYIHGQGGNRRQGVNDWTFGGNFNRLQNLMVKNNGLLLTPDFSDFKARGAADIATLVRKTRAENPNTKIVLACGSMGGGICWRLASNRNTSKLVDGLFILGSHWSDIFLESVAIKKSTRNIPIYIGHGAADPVFAPSRQHNFFTSILKKNPEYPVRFVMFDTGAHGTPIRMVDWRAEINWMLSPQ